MPRAAAARSIGLTGPRGDGVIRPQMIAGRFAGVISLKWPEVTLKWLTPTAFRDNSERRAVRTCHCAPVRRIRVGLRSTPP